MFVPEDASVGIFISRGILFQITPKNPVKQLPMFAIATLPMAKSHEE